MVPLDGTVRVVAGDHITLRRAATCAVQPGSIVLLWRLCGGIVVANVALGRHKRLVKVIV